MQIAFYLPSTTHIQVVSIYWMICYHEFNAFGESNKHTYYLALTSSKYIWYDIMSIRS